MRAALAGIAAGLALGCASAPAEPPAPVTEETHRAAAAAVLALAADPAARLELFEGGFTADAWTWRTEERVVWDDLHGVGLLGPPLPRAPRVVRERRLEGPMRTAFRFGDLVSAAPYAMLLATDVELRVRGEAEPFLLDVGGREAARRLAAALDVLIRARDAAP